MFQKLKTLYTDRDNQKKNLVWLIRQTAPFRMLLLGVILLRSFLALLGVASSLISKHLVDQAQIGGSLVGGIFLAVGSAAGSIALGSLLTFWLDGMMERYTFHIRSSLFRHILEARWKQAERYHSEELLTRLTSDVQLVSGGIVATVSISVSLVVQLTAAFLLLWSFSPALAVWILCLGLAGTLAAAGIGRGMKTLQECYQRSEEKYRVFLQESIAQLPVLKAFVCEEICAGRLEELREDRLYWVKKKNRLALIVNTAVRLLFTAGYLSAFISGTALIADGSITYGTMTAFLSLVSQIQSPVQLLADSVKRGIAVLASAGRLMEIQEMETEERTGRPDRTFGRLAGIRGKNISFSYEKGTILDRFSFVIPAGRMTAVVGDSGAGKTTLIRLLLNFLQPDTGELVFFDTEGREIPVEQECRKQMSYVPQGNTLFSGSIRYNLQLVCPEADEMRMKEALELACAREFVERLPQGLDTVIGEKAAGLSEGQAQRISIARAILSRRPVMLLDEATSALDGPTEMKILKNLSSLDWKPTCIFITHRKAALQFSGHIIEIPAGGRG